MTTYYVDYVNGSDANNGLGPDATTGNTNKPWKTLTKLIGATGMASGDTAYLSPAGPFREVSISAGGTYTAETKIIGDPGNAQGFKTSAGVRVAPGPIINTAYVTNDKTLPTANAQNMTLNNKNFLTFQYIMFVLASGTNAGLTSGSTGGHDVKFLDCAFVPGVKGDFNGSIGIMNINAPANVSANWTFDRCIILKPSSNSNAAFRFVLATSTSADWDSNILVQNCLFLGGSAPSVYVGSSGANSFKGGGVRVKNCTQIGGSNLLTTIGTSLSTSIPCTAIGNVVYNPNSPVFVAGASSQITEDYNVYWSTGTNTNVSAGAHSITDGSYAPLFLFGQERLWGMAQRMVGTPMSGSPLLGFGDDGNAPAYDLFNSPRPAGGASALKAIGALERGNTWGQETTTVRTGANAISITGPGYQDFDIPVDATSTVVTVYLRYDSTYAGTRPQFSVLNGEECGVAAASVTASTSALNAWEQQSLTIVPTSKGIVTVRVQSNDTNGGGKAFADDFAVA